LLSRLAFFSRFTFWVLAVIALEFQNPAFTFMTALTGQSGNCDSQLLCVAFTDNIFDFAVLWMRRLKQTELLMPVLFQ